MSYDFNRLYPHAQSDKNSTWTKRETACLFKNYMSHVVSSLFNSGRRNELNRCVFLTVENQNPENVVFQHIPV